MDVVLYSPTDMSQRSVSVGGCSRPSKTAERPRPSLRAQKVFWACRWDLRTFSRKFVQRVRFIGSLLLRREVEVLCWPCSGCCGPRCFHRFFFFSFGVPAEVFGFGAPAEVFCEGLLRALPQFLCSHRLASGGGGGSNSIIDLFICVVINIFCDFPEVRRANPRSFQ